MNDWSPAVLITLVTALGGLLLGIAAYRKSGAEARKYLADSKKADADATVAITGSAADVVLLLRTQMQEMRKSSDEQRDQISMMNERIMHLEVTVGSWEGWAERVLSLLDRTVDMLQEEQRVKLSSDVAAVKKARPPHGGRQMVNAGEGGHTHTHLASDQGRDQ